MTNLRRPFFSVCTTYFDNKRRPRPCGGAVRARQDDQARADGRDEYVVAAR
jgi:hypothetical protein